MSAPAAKPAAPKQAKAPKAKGAPKEKKEKAARRLGVTVKDVPADLFIKEYASYLQKAGKLRTPKWVDYVKTGITRELGPLNPDWLYVRAASMARKMYLRPCIGLGTFCRMYGGSKRRGVRPCHSKPGSGSVARFVLKELDRLKVCEKDKNGGRKLTQTGQRDLDRIAGKVAAQHPVHAL